MNVREQMLWNARKVMTKPFDGQVLFLLFGEGRDDLLYRSS